MIIVLLILVLLTNGLGFVLRRQFRNEAWKRVHMAFAGLTLTSSGFLVMLTLFLVFDSIELQHPSQEAELKLFNGSIVVLVISLAFFLSQFFRRLKY